MAGNTVLSFWDVEEANKLLLFSTRDPWNVETATVDPHRRRCRTPRLPPGCGEVAVNRVGYRDNTIDFIPLIGFRRWRCGTPSLSISTWLGSAHRWATTRCLQRRFSFRGD